MRLSAADSIVTPHVGVWIETSNIMRAYKNIVVTPHVGVWIETNPLWLRLAGLSFVTPHVGVWIETCVFRVRDSRDSESHLM